MRFDMILPRLEPNADYDFATIETTEISRKAGELAPTEKIVSVRVYDDYDFIIWTDKVIKQPSLAACEAEWVVYQHELSNEAIDEKRVSEYGSVGEQLDMIYWDAINNTTIWLDRITLVKADNPKL